MIPPPNITRRVISVKTRSSCTLICFDFDPDPNIKRINLSMLVVITGFVVSYLGTYCLFLSLSYPPRSIEPNRISNEFKRSIQEL